MQQLDDKEAEEWRREAEEGKPDGYYESFIDRTTETLFGCVLIILFLLILLVIICKLFYVC